MVKTSNSGGLSMDQYSENDYENVTSNHIVKTRNCKGPSNYQNSENVYENTPIHRGIRDSSGPAHHSDRRACIWVAVGLATVCILQLSLNVYLYMVTYTTSGEDLLKITMYDNLTKERDQLQTSYKNLTKERDQLLTSYNTLAKERDQLQTSYNNLAKERDQLQTSYNNLIKERDQLQTSYNTLAKERDQLQTSYNNLSKKRDQLQTSYNNLIKERDQLQTSYNTLAKERDQLQTSYNNLNNQFCPKNWTKFDCSGYYISSVKKNWTDSRKDCLDRGGDLVIINSREEQNFIKALGLRSWIGLTDRDDDGTWKWVDRTPVITSYWNSGEPNGGKQENCGENKITTNDPILSWNDEPCDHQHHFICERLK